MAFLHCDVDDRAVRRSELSRAAAVLPVVNDERNHTNDQHPAGRAADDADDGGAIAVVCQTGAGSNNRHRDARDARDALTSGS